MKYSMVGGLSATSGLAVDPEPINEQCQRLYALNGVNDGTPLTLNKSVRSGDLTYGRLHPRACDTWGHPNKRW